MQVMIRLAALAIPLVCLAPAFAEEARPSAAACDTSKIGARDLAECLKGASDKSERDLAATVEAAIKTIEARADLKPAQKTRWKRLLNDAEAQWMTWRDAECQDVAPFEAGVTSKGGDPRLACFIDENTRRTADLQARYR